MPNSQFIEFLSTATLQELRDRRAWLDDYANRTWHGHSEIAANLRLYDEEIERRVAALYREGK